MQVLIGTAAVIGGKPRPHVQLPELLVGFVTGRDILLAENIYAVCNPVEIFVMKKHRDAVRCHMKVKFKNIWIIFIIFNAPAESHKSVFWQNPGAASVGGNLGDFADEWVRSAVFFNVSR